MNPILTLTLFLNILFATREFFAVSEHILQTKRRHREPDFEDYFELWAAGVIALITLFSFCILSFGKH
jgi:hypothetical protein